MLNSDANCWKRARWRYWPDLLILSQLPWGSHVKAALWKMQSSHSPPPHPPKIFSSGKFTLFLGKLLRDVVLILLIQEKSAFLITARLLNVQMKWNYDFFHAQSAHWEVPKGRESCLRRSFRHLKLLNITFVIDFKVLKQKVFVAFSLSFLGLLALSSFCQLLGN